MNENKRIDNLRIKIAKCLGAKAYDEKKGVETLQKQLIGVIFNIQNSQLLTWSLITDRRNLSGAPPK